MLMVLGMEIKLADEPSTCHQLPKIFYLGHMTLRLIHKIEGLGQSSVEIVSLIGPYYIITIM